MKSKIAVLCAIALTQIDISSAHKLVQQEQGIFSKMMEMSENEGKEEREYQEKKKRHEQDMIEAEKEH